MERTEMDGIIRWVLKNPFLTLTLIAFLVALGIISAYKTPLDAIPDISDTQVIIEARWEGQDPTTIEDQVTYPIVSAMLSAPKTKAVRGFSMPNKSLIYNTSYLRMERIFIGRGVGFWSTFPG